MLNICTIKGLSVRELPPGGRGEKPSEAPEAKEEDSTGSGRNVEQLIKDALSEGIPFIDGVSPKAGGDSTWKSRRSPKKYPDSDALVYQFEKTVLGKDLRTGVLPNGADVGKKEVQNNETWFCRKSCHKNTAEKGTASWEEFTRGFKEQHAETEKGFIPTVIAVRKAITWDTNGIKIELNGERWTNISLELWEMKHRIDPKPLHNRTFPSLHITAALEGANEFMVAQIPIPDMETSPYADFARDKSLVVAAYTSVERIRILPENGEIEWVMATASDAGGVLPQWMQNMAVPGAISKDVQMFLAWIPSQRIAKG